LLCNSGLAAFRADIETEPDVPAAVKELARARGYRAILVVPMGAPPPSRFRRLPGELGIDK
jgi:hypothetical protein